MSTFAIELKNVDVSLRGAKVLEDVSFTLDRGEFLGLIGPNGGGKTTLLRLLLGLIKPDRGEVSILGTSVLAARGKVGYVPQYAKFDADFPITVLDVVLMGRLKPGRKRLGYTTEDRLRAGELLDKVELGSFATRQIGKLSAGQLQRVLIARALAVEPQLLLLDEPTASLDTQVGRNIYSLLDELSKQITIVLVSHDIGVISSHVRAIACLNRKLHFHNSREITGDMLEEVYGCPVELLAHGQAHRVLAEHGETHAHHHHTKREEK